MDLGHMEPYFRYQIQKAQDGQTVKEILTGIAGLSSRRIAKLKNHDAGILLDGETVTVRKIVSAGQELAVLQELDPVVCGKIVPVCMPLSILYEDSHLLLLDKPAGMVCHPSQGHWQDSLCNGVAYYFSKQQQRNGIHLIGRLDKDTSGIVCIAKNAIVAQRMTDLQKSGKMHKEYLALVYGKMEHSHGDIRIPMQENRLEKKGRMERATVAEGKKAVTHYRVIKQYERWALCQVWLDTGRTHQIRFHMSQIGHALLFDPWYGKNPGKATECTMLHAWKLSFVHPVLQEKIEIQTLFPERLQKYMSTAITEMIRSF